MLNIAFCHLLYVPISFVLVEGPGSKVMQCGGLMVSRNVCGMDAEAGNPATFSQARPRL